MFSMDKGRLVAEPGSTIHLAAKEVVEMAQKMCSRKPGNGYLILAFNETEIKVWSDSKSEEIISEYNSRRSQLYATNPAFAVHKLNDQGLRRAAEIATHFNALLLQLEAQCPSGREMAIVRTKLEEACFFAKKSVAMDSRNQES